MFVGFFCCSLVGYRSVGCLVEHWYLASLHSYSGVSVFGVLAAAASSTMAAASAQQCVDTRAGDFRLPAEIYRFNLVAGKHVFCDNSARKTS